jgi:hypothetical protein
MHVRPNITSQPQPLANPEPERYQPRQVDEFEKYVPLKIKRKLEKSANPEILKLSRLRPLSMTLIQRLNAWRGFVSGVVLTQVLSAPVRALLARIGIHIFAGSPAVMQGIAAKVLFLLAPFVAPSVAILGGVMPSVVASFIALAALAYATKRLFKALSGPGGLVLEAGKKKGKIIYAFVKEQLIVVKDLLIRFKDSDIGQGIIKMARSLWQVVTVVAKSFAYVLHGLLQVANIILDFFIGLPQQLIRVCKSLIAK